MDPGDDRLPELAVRIAAEDVNAFQTLFEREAAGLVRYASGLLGSREDAKDAVQDAFLRFWMHRRRLQPDTDPVRLLFTIVRNLARDRLRRMAVEQRPHPRFEGGHIVEAGPLLAPDGEEPDELQAAVLRALESLSPRQRQVVLLRWRRHLTYEEIAGELGIAPGTASAHMQRAIAQLKQSLAGLLGRAPA
jgi:RNA polymerase sigma-70 factor (ECF subfamily)